MNCQRDGLLGASSWAALCLRAWSAGPCYRVDWLTFTPVEAIAKSGVGLCGRKRVQWLEGAESRLASGE
jgi:hypothetical protein